MASSETQCIESNGCEIVSDDVLAMTYMQMLVVSVTLPLNQPPLNQTLECYGIVEIPYDLIKYRVE
jgi:hypothetical protein